MTASDYQFITKTAEDAFTNALTRAGLYNGQDIMLDDLCSFIMNCNLYLWQGQFHVNAVHQAFSATFDKDINKTLEVLYEFNAFFNSALVIAGLDASATLALHRALSDNITGDSFVSKASPAEMTEVLESHPWYSAIANIRVFGFSALMKAFMVHANGKPATTKKSDAK